ncbi:restriction endonuclease subunit S [Streptomyces sp. NPDC005209]|uniref:restriction endonuclease subunit S n=1 Tax=Streptomyces sp. NPDC005209 TaxID=3156715 RepID=UPI0033A2421F
MSEIRPAEIPHDWKTYELGQVASRVVRKNHVGNKNVLTISAKHGLVSQEEYFQRRVASSDARSYFLLDRGDFAYNKSYSEGYPAGVIRRLDRYDSGIVSPLYICFRPKSEVDSDFLAHYFESGILNEDILWVAKEGVRNHGLLNVKVSDFFSLPVHLPPIEEQRRIAEILDTIDHEIQGSREVIAGLSRLESGLTSELLTSASNTTASLESLTESVLDGVHHTPTYTPSGIPFITVENLTRGPDISFSPCRYISTEDHRAFSRRIAPRAGDVLVSKDGTLGVARVVPDGAPEFSIFVSVALLRPHAEKISPDFLALFFDSHLFHSQLAALSSGSGLKHIHLHEMKSFRVPLPPIAEQVRILEKVEAARRVRRFENLQLSKLIAIKEGLAHDLLTGQVRVQEAEAALAEI